MRSREHERRRDAGVAAEAPGRTVVDGVDVLGSLSPSRARDFMSCPLLFRFRTVDRLPGAAVARGGARHGGAQGARGPLRPARGRRTPARAADLLLPAWERDPRGGARGRRDVRDARAPRWAPGWRRCRTSLRRYFALEDPTRLEPAERELYVETLLDSKLLLRGFVDRLDVAPTGEIRVVDYKTGRAPHEAYEAKALFQMKFYALVLWRTRGVVPAMLQLIYLGSGEVLRYAPDERDLLATERKVEALWRAIVTAQETGDWRPPRARCAAGAPTSRSAPSGVAPLRRCRRRRARRAAHRRPDRRGHRLATTSRVSRLRSAQSAACVRSATPICWNTEVRCALTVRSLIPSRRAICLFASPARTSASTSVSRLVSCTAAADVSLRAVSSWRATFGWIGDSPRLTARTPSRTSSGSASLSR